MRLNLLLKPLQLNPRSLPYFVLAVTLLLTAGVTSYLAKTIEEKDEIRFENAVQRTQDDIQNRIETYIALLRGGRALFTASEDVTRAEFQAYIEKIELQQRYPGIQGIGFSVRVLPSEKEALIAQMRQQGLENFTIRPEYNRTEYHAIIYLEPFDRRNQAAIGFDMFSEATRRAAMARARDTGNAAASGRVTLVQEIDEQKQAGFLIYVPIYHTGVTPQTVAERRDALKGFIYSPFRADDLMATIFGSQKYPFINLQIYDGTELKPENLLHVSEPTQVAANGLQKPRFQTTQIINIAGRPWTVVMTTRREFELTSGRSLVYYIGLSGILFGWVLFYVTRSQVRARHAAERVADDLRQSEIRFRTLIEQSPMSTQILSPDGRTIEVNRAFEELWGVKLEQLKGYNILEDRQLVKKGIMPYIQKAFAGEATAIPPILYDRNQGLPDIQFEKNIQLSVRAQIYPVKDKAGEIREVVILHEDITERQRVEQALKESEERYRQLTEKVRVIPWEVNYKTGKFTYVGPQSQEILGYPLEDWYTEDFWGQHMHPEDREWAIAFCANSAIKLDNYEFEYRMLAADGQVVWLYDLVNVVRDGNEPMLLRGILIDITERKRIEAERLQLLEREQAARAEAEAANRMKDEFLATLSHELRTPLNSMLGWTKLLRTRKFDPNTTDRALETIDRNTKSLSQLIEDLLDVSRIMTGKFRLEMRPVRLAAVLEAAIEAVQPAAVAKNIQIDSAFDDPVSVNVLGDSTRLQQIIWNLLTNAIKFTPPEGKVEVRLESDRWNAKIRVTDTGQGIAADFLPYIFERFRQADASITRKHGGLGLGLSIVRHLVESHGGTIRAQSEGEGRGATFIVQLPRLHGNRGTEESGSQGANAGDLALSPSAPLEGLRVLIVDDEADARMLIMTMLGESGAKLTAVASASEAFELIRGESGAHRPDILISDIGMPGEDGYSLIRKIRALAPDPGGEIPAIALTAYAREEDRARALSAGFQMHLTKPVIAEELIGAIASLTGRGES